MESNFLSIDEQLQSIEQWKCWCGLVTLHIKTRFDGKKYYCSHSSIYRLLKLSFSILNIWKINQVMCSLLSIDGQNSRSNIVFFSTPKYNVARWKVKCSQSLPSTHLLSPSSSKTSKAKLEHKQINEKARLADPGVMWPMKICLYWANDLKSDHFLGCEISKIIEHSTDMNQVTIEIFHRNTSP